jgi:hypothetical protein
MTKRMRAILGVAFLLGGQAAFAAPHAADTNDDLALGFSEILRVIQLYHADAYQCMEATEDGYAPGAGDDSCDPHSSDYLTVNRIITLNELLRAIQLFNAGAYRVDCLGEDGFAPGAGDPLNCDEEGEAEGPLVFADPNLEAAVRDAVGIPEDPLYPDDVTGLLELAAPLSEINDLGGIEALSDLQSLDLHGNCVSDLSPLAGLTDLVSLNLHDNDITDISDLAGLDQLDYLWLGRNTIADLSPLAANLGLESDPQAEHWDRVNVTFNPLDNAATPAAIAALESREVFVWQSPGSEMNKQRVTETLRVHLRFTDQGVTLVRHVTFPGPATNPRRGDGPDGTLRVIAEREVIDVPVWVDFDVTACGTADDMGTIAGEETRLEAVDRVYTIPLTGALDRIAFRPDALSAFTPLYEAPAEKGMNPCAPAEEPGDPIPISGKLIFGDPGLPDENAYVILLMGDAFVADNLGDPNLVAGQHDTSFIPYSQAMADSMRFIFENEPFAEYANLFKVYRIDLISRDDTPTDLRENPPLEYDTALGMGRKSVGFEYDQALAYRVANNTGIAADRIVLFPNGTGSGTQTGDFIVYSGFQVSRRMTALHEFGHGVGLLADEYEFRHGTNPPTPYDPDDVDEPNAIARNLDLPTFDEIPWKHWLPDEMACPSGHLGAPVDFDCETPDCQCGPIPVDPMDCVPVPTCEPDGNLIINNVIYGRPEWPEPGDPAAVIGLFEGAKYRTKGCYRAELRCRMRSDDDTPPGEDDTPHFCTVCRERLVMEFVTIAGLSRATTPAATDPVIITPGDPPLDFTIEPHTFPGMDHAVELVEWQLDATPVPGETGFTISIDPQELTPDTAYTLTAVLRDHTPWVHPDFEAGQAAVQKNITWNLSVLPE